MFYRALENTLHTTSTQVKTPPPAARGNNVQARGKITDCRRNTTTGLWIGETGCRNKTSEVKDTDQKKWTTPLVSCNKNLTKFNGNFNRKF
jgi:hypothetical protein